MREALNWAGQYVDAEVASSGLGLYVCPECRTPVSLRAGGSKRAYFAHMPGRSGKDCHLYVEGGASGSALTGLGENNNNAPMAMHLGLRLANTPTPRGWGLELVVPIDGHIGLELTLDVGGRTETVRSTSDTKKEISAIAEPARSYEILSISSASPAYLDNLVRTCEGLNLEYATAFGEIRRPGKELAQRVYELSIGRTYALVWPASLEPVFPAALEYVPLKSRPNWEGALITLSYPVEPSVRNWLHGFTKLEIATTLPEIVPVWPPLVRRVTGGLVEVPTKSAVIVCAGRFTPAGIIGANALFMRSLRGEKGQNAKSVSEPFFHAVLESDDSIELSCLDPARVSLNVDVVTSPKYLEQSTVGLAGVASNGEIQLVGLHESEATRLLAALRNKTVSLSYLSIPKNVVGCAAIGRDGIWEDRLKLHGSDVPTPHDSGARLLCPDDLTTLAEILFDQEYDVLLDFGAFGRIISTGNGTPVNISALSRRMRERLLAYLFQTRGKIPSSLSARKAKDMEIISEFLKEPLGAADATWRSLKSALEREFEVCSLNPWTRI